MLIASSNKTRVELPPVAVLSIADIYCLVKVNKIKRFLLVAGNEVKIKI
jgi:hypothetical protein